MNQDNNDVSDEEFKKVIADFLDKGHVENIIALFRREESYYEWTGELLRDDRFSVRLGISVLFEELKKIQPEKLDYAIASLCKLLKSDSPNLRGEALSLLGIIGSEAALKRVHLHQEDENSQVREIRELVLSET